MKKGDVIIALTSSKDITQGKEYTIIAVMSDVNIIAIEFDNGSASWIHANEFKLKSKLLFHHRRTSRRAL